MMPVVPTLTSLKEDLQHLSDPKKAKDLQWYFKTKPGEYGAGDMFIGITVPNLRSLVPKYRHLPLADSETLLHSPIHEERMLALFLLVKQFANGTPVQQEAIYTLYLRNTAYINNWDLVDCSAGYIVGGFLEDKDRVILRTLAVSQSLWERRIAIISTLAFIVKGHCETTLEIAELLLHDTQDLIHKAVGWMLREVGKRCSLEAEEAFLQQHAAQMPRTMLRYAIEKFPEEKRKYYMAKRA